MIRSEVGMIVRLVPSVLFTVAVLVCVPPFLRPSEAAIRKSLRRLLSLARYAAGGDQVVPRGGAARRW